MRDNLSAALEFAVQGYAVFPLHAPSPNGCDCNKRGCLSPAKHPRTTHGLTDATTDLDQVEEWWEMWPHANIGVATGPVSGIVVLDVDPRDGGDVELVDLVQTYELLPAGLSYETGSGGTHYWFRHPGRKILSHKLSGQKGLDVKADGGYVIVPPSVHITGGSYEFYEDINVTTTLPDIPYWLLEMMLDTPEWDGGAAQIPEVVSKGDRNSKLTSIGGTLRRRGLPRQAIFKALAALNLEICSEPLDEKEVAQIAASVSRYEPEIETPVVVGGEVKTVVGLVSPGEPVSMRDLKYMELPPIRWAVPDLLPEGLCLFAGRVKIGKSWWCLELCRAVAEGDTGFAYTPCEDGDTLYLALEDDLRRLQSRGRMMLDAEGDWPERMMLVPMNHGWPRMNLGGLEAIDGWLGRHPDARLVIIDTWAKFAPVPDPRAKKGNAYMEDYATIDPLQKLALQHHVAIVVVTHFNKALHDDWVNQISGSTGLTGASDTLMALSRPRGKKGQAEAQLRGAGRDLPELDLALSLDGNTGRWSVLGETETTTQSQGTAEILEKMRAIGKPVTKVEIAALTGKTQAAAYMALYRASVEGQVVAYGRGLFGLAEQPIVSTEGLENGSRGGGGVVVVGVPDNITALTPLTGLTANGTEQAKEPAPWWAKDD